jgi:hypothetical protein
MNVDRYPPPESAISPDDWQQAPERVQRGG